MWVSQCHKPPIFLGMEMVNIPSIYSDDWGIGRLRKPPGMRPGFMFCDGKNVCETTHLITDWW